MPATHFAPRRSRLPALALVLCLHIGMLLAWKLMRDAPRPAPSDAPAMQWIDIQPPRSLPKPAPAKVKAAAVPPSPRLARVLPPTPPAPAPPAPARESQAITLVPADPFAAPAPPAPDIVKKALGAVGKIDRDLRRESPSKIHAPLDTPQTRLVAGIQAARKQHWDEPASIEEINAPDDGSGRRMSKIKTPFGTYCATVASNHSGPDMFESNKAGPKLTTCPH